MKKKNKTKQQKQKKTKAKYYAVIGRNDKFLHGVFPFSKEGLVSAKVYLSKLDPLEKNLKIKKY